MKWFGDVSAWGAVVMGVVLVGAQLITEGSGQSIITLTAITLLYGAFRTLRKMSGGLRLLAGAWGLSAGLLGAAPMWVSLAALTPAFAWFTFAAAFVSLAGLALTVLHKEK